MWHRSLLKFALLGSACVLPAIGQDYFPLHVGNQWVYRTSGTRAGAPLVKEITRSQVFNGQTYYLLRWPSKGEFWLRMTEDKKLVELSPESGSERVWYDFGAPLQEVYDTALPSCCGRAMIRSRSATYKGTLGEFPVLEMVYPGVFQVGIDRELFVPYIGMVYRFENTGGPSVATYDLSYARIGGVTVVAENHLGFSLALDKTVYKPGEQMLARITLRNTRDPLTLRFTSGQIYNLQIRNAKGEVVYHWAADKIFPAREQTIVVEGERTFPVLFNIPDLAAGEYSIEAWLVASNFPERSFLARTGFDVNR